MRRNMLRRNAAAGSFLAQFCIAGGWAEEHGAQSRLVRRDQVWSRLKASRPFAERRATLRQDLPHDAAVHVGQAEVAAGVAVGEPLVVQAQKMEDRGVQVVDV